MDVWLSGGSLRYNAASLAEKTTNSLEKAVLTC